MKDIDANQRANRLQDFAKDVTSLLFTEKWPSQALLKRNSLVILGNYIEPLIPLDDLYQFQQIGLIEFPQCFAFILQQILLGDIAMLRQVDEFDGYRFLGEGDFALMRERVPLKTVEVAPLPRI